MWVSHCSCCQRDNFTLFYGRSAGAAAFVVDYSDGLDVLAWVVFAKNAVQLAFWAGRTTASESQFLRYARGRFEFKVSCSFYRRGISSPSVSCAGGGVFDRALD